jgi:hypothetical protein
LDKSIAFISELKKIEDNQYHKDPFLLSKSFSLNNDKLNGIYINDITIQTSFSIIFSFCFSPNETKKNKKDVKEYPILHLCDNNKNELYFFIKDGALLYKNFCSDKKIKIFDIIENQTYLCFFSVKEKENYIIQIVSKELYSVKNKFQFSLKKMNATLHIGKMGLQNFEGFMGPVIIFRKFLEEIPKYFFPFKGEYENAAFFHDYNTNEVDIYENIMNNEPDKFSELKKSLQAKEEFSKYIIAYVTPMEEGQSLNKLCYINKTFAETKIFFTKNQKLKIVRHISHLINTLFLNL